MRSRLKNFVHPVLWPTHIRLLAVLMGSLWWGCTPAYVPNRQHMPLLRQKGELSANLNTSNLQLAYSPLQGLGLMLNASYMEITYRYTRNCPGCPIDPAESYYNRHRQGLAEAGIGYYAPVSPDSTWMLELYGGYGAGPVRMTIRHLLDSVSLNRSVFSVQHRVFLQPAVGWRKQNMELAFSCRLSALRFASTRFRDFTPEQIRQDGYQDLYPRTHLLLEPAITCRFGKGWLKLETQAGLSNPTTYVSGTRPRPYVRPRGFFNLALQLRLPRPKKIPEDNF